MPKDEEFNAGRGVCKILDDKGSGTGFLSRFTLNGNREMCGLFTNNHVLGEKHIAPDPDNSSSPRFTLEFHFYHALAADSEIMIVSIEVDNKLLKQFFGVKFTCPILDATFIEFNKEMVHLIKRKTEVTGLQVEYLPLVEREEYTKIKRLQVIGHPVEECDGTKHFATGDLCDVKGYNILHKASTTPGSSGSPLVANGSVIGIHKAAGVGNYNIAVSIVDVCTAIEKSLQPENKILPQNGLNVKLKEIGMTLRYQHCRGRVYSIIKKDKEIWCTHTAHGWHYTLSNPAEVENYHNFTSNTLPNPAEVENYHDSTSDILGNYHDHMFDMLAWMPLSEPGNADTICKELTAELDKHLKL